MAQCSYIYASGLRIKSGEGLVELDGKVLRVVRDGKGASRLERALDNPRSDGEITLKDLSVALASRGMSSTKISIGVGESKFSTTLLPDEGMGRQGRQGDAAAAFASMTPQEQQSAAVYQLTESLPYSDKSSAKETKARVAAALAIVDVSKLTSTLPEEFGLYAAPDQMAKALAAADVKDALRFADAASFVKLANEHPLDALTYATDRLADDHFAIIILNLKSGYFGAAPELPEAARIRYAQEQFAPVREAVEAGDFLNAYQLGEVLRQQAALSADATPSAMSRAAAIAAVTAASEDPAYLAAAANSGDESVRSAAARYSHSPELLTVMALDEKPFVRYSAAQNSSTPPAALKLLAEDKKAWVRASVAQNESAPVALLNELMTDKSPEVRAGVAANGNTPVAALEALMNDKKEEVRKAVASNAATPATLLTVIAEDASIPWRSLLGLAPGVTNASDRVAALLNPALPGHVLAKLSTEERAHTRGMVAANRSTPPEVLAILGSDDDLRVRACAAANRNTPPATLAQLCKDIDGDVCGIAVRNPATPAKTLVELAGTQSFAVVANPSAPREALEVLAKSNIAEIRRAVGVHPNADEELKAAVAADIANAPKTAWGAAAEDLTESFDAIFKDLREKW